MPEPLTALDFALHDTYAAAVEGHTPVDLELVELEPSDDPRRFSIVFRGPLESELQQGVYDLTHADRPVPLTIFIVPIAREADGLRYQAVFA